MPGTVGAGGGPEPAGDQCGVPPGAGGGPEPAGTQCGEELAGGGVAAVLLTVVVAVPDAPEGGVPCGEELAEAGTASHRPAASPAAANDTPPTTKLRLRSLCISTCPSIFCTSIESDNTSMSPLMWPSRVLRHRSCGRGARWPNEYPALPGAPPSDHDPVRVKCS